MTQHSPTAARQYFVHDRRLIEVTSGEARVVTDQADFTHVPVGLAFASLPPVLRVSAAGPVHDRARLNLATLRVEPLPITRVSTSMIARAVVTGRDASGLTRDEALPLMRDHLCQRGHADVRRAVLKEQAWHAFSPGQLAAVLRAPHLATLPWWARTYDVATGRVPLHADDLHRGIPPPHRRGPPHRPLRRRPHPRPRERPLHRRP